MALTIRFFDTLAILDEYSYLFNINKRSRRALPPMYTIKDLIIFSVPETRVAIDRLSENPRAMSEDYRKIMREIPNLHVFFMRVRSFYGNNPTLINNLWFRIWAAIKTEEEIGFPKTLNLLKKLPNIDDRCVRLEYKDVKPISYCFEILHELVTSA